MIKQGFIAKSIIDKIDKFIKTMAMQTNILRDKIKRTRDSIKIKEYNRQILRLNKRSIRARNHRNGFKQTNIINVKNV